MNIRASKVDDLRKEKQQWQMRHDARKQLYNDQEGQFSQARWDWQDNIADLVRKTFKSYIDKLPYLEINVDYSWRQIEVRFRYADYHGRDAENVSLRWSYDISLTESGQVKRETNSWSGFDAVTPEQVEDLMNSANFLKAIVDYDWAPLLQEAKNSMPKPSQYIAVRDPDRDDEYRDPGYDRMIREAEIEEAITSGKWFKTIGNFGYDRWSYIVSQTPKFYEITSISEYDITHANDTNANNIIRHITDPANSSPYYIDRVKKDKVKFTNPIETKTSDELVQMVGQAL